MRNLNSDLADKSNERWRTPYVDIIAVGIIQFFLNIFMMCYGVFLMQFVLKEAYSLRDSLWTAVAFVGASKITYPWARSYCKHLETIRRKVHKRNIIAFVVPLCLTLVSLSFFQTVVNTIIFYGIFGGIFSSIISAHLNYATAQAFKPHPQLFTILDHLMKSFCLFIMPHFILFLINFYGTKPSFLILSAIMLNIIPACLLIQTTRPQKVKLCKFQTLDKLSIEMADLSKPVTNDMSSSSDEEDGENREEEITVEVEKSDDNEEKPGTSSNVQKYYQNVGVKIMPDIQEESDYEEDDDINEISSKRLSRISMILQEINVNQRRDSNLSINNLYQPEETIETVIETMPEPENAIPDFVFPPKKSSCCSINSSTISSIIYKIKMKRRRLKSFCYRHFVKSVPRTLENFYFYPALISSTITTTISTIIFATAPYLMFLKNKNHSNTPEETTFLLTIIGFTWLFFLAGYPVFNKLSSLKTKILFLVGLSILGLSLFIVHKFSYDNFVLFSLTFGLGYGIVTYAEDIANEDFFGPAKWKMLKGALEICTGFIVILTYLIIYFSYLDINIVVFYAYWLYVFDVGLWIFAYITKKIYIYCRNTERYKRERFPDYNF